MAHVRKTIRAALVAALREKISAIEPRNIFERRLDTVQDPLELPALNCYVEDEDVDTVRTTLARTLEFVVEAVFKDAQSLDDQGEDILEDCEKVLGAPDVALGGAKWIRIVRVEFEAEKGAQAAAKLRMVFNVFYYTAHGAPSVAL